MLERAGPCPERTLRTWSDEATGGSGFSSLCWPRNPWRAYSARWMSQLVYNGLSLFGAQNACVSAALAPQGTRPAYPAEEPPYRPLVPCYTQALPNFNGPLSQGPADGNG